ncbi:MAG: KH domain-containing protein [Peptoniphilaceae bacterium]|nr:KH domain-containing protein [Peptoniphilaceae bacterium]MDD7383152.1 KH domain-containing protein [Peptoniphilaceae bacterium]MDY3738117.1 KH domain-containing protein [Peptoniphilaceae bacterium]
MKKLIVDIVKAIVDNPNSVKVEEVENDGIVDITISVDDSDKGKVIGKNGKIINSVRTIAKACAIKENVKVNVRI